MGVVINSFIVRESLEGKKSIITLLNKFSS